MLKRLLFVHFSLFSFLFSLKAQEQQYFKDPNPAIQKKLEDWQDLKFGLLMHWGTYSQWGIVESWSLCPEDEGWTKRRGPYANDWYTYKQAYENLQTTFNPVKFNPEKWALAAKNANKGCRSFRHLVNQPRSSVLRRGLFQKRICGEQFPQT